MVTNAIVIDRQLKYTSQDVEHPLLGFAWYIRVAYLHDRIVFLKTPREHFKRLQKVL